MNKQFYKSKTVWFNVVTILVVFLGYTGYTPNPEVVKQTSDLLLALSPFINFALRFYTDKKLTIR